MHHKSISLLVLIFNSSLLLVTRESHTSLDACAWKRVSTLLCMPKHTITYKASNLLLCLQTECHCDPD